MFSCVCDYSCLKDNGTVSRVCEGVNGVCGHLNKVTVWIYVYIIICEYFVIYV